MRRIETMPKPVIAMVHLNPMPGTPLYDADAGIEGIYRGALRDLEALQAAGRGIHGHGRATGRVRGGRHLGDGRHGATFSFFADRGVAIRAIGR